ncbi:MAG: hypothetical protein ACOVPA_11815, partial [Rubrivivax sp.]
NNSFDGGITLNRGGIYVGTNRSLGDGTLTTTADVFFGVIDDDLLYLSLALTGLALHVHLSRDVAHAVRPGLLQGQEAVGRWGQRLVEQALALVQAEAARRGLVLAPPGA